MAKQDVGDIRRDGLTFVHDPPGADLDVFILHGLGGSPLTTFRCEGTGFFWPRHLSAWLPKARICLFGYIADVASGSDNSMGLQQHAESLLFHLKNNRAEQQPKRPIVFLGHSFGGNVIKQALILSSNRRTGCDVLESTRSIIFLGVPHYGSHLLRKNRAPLVMALGKAANHAVPPNVLSALRPEANEMYAVNTQFMRIKGDISIVNFYEQKPQGLVGDLVVERGSAIFDSETSENMPVARNHRDLVRFETAQDDFYHTLCQTLRRKVAEFMTAKKEAELHENAKRKREAFLNIIGDTSLTSSLEQAKSPHPNTLRWIWDKDSEIRKWIMHGRGLFAVTGKPGSGKSVLMDAVNMEVRKHFGNSFSTVACHFFNSRGNPIEKSPEGFLRSVLFQLVQEDIRFFHRLEQDWEALWGRRFGNTEPEPSAIQQFQRQNLTVSALKEMLCRAVNDVSRKQQVLILVDGIDECEADPTGPRSIASLLDGLVSAQDSLPIMICFSCRSLPSYGFTQLFSSFNLQERNRSDITKFIDDHWKSMPPICNYDEEMNKLKMSLISRANGVFLWVRLVLEGVQKALATGATISEIKTIIDTPNQLYGLFSMLLSRIDPSFLEESRTMLSIILTAKRPLSLREFRYILALKDRSFESQDALNKSPDVIQSDDTMKRRIMSRCGGLVEVKVAGDLARAGEDETDNNSIQFIHQSVKDFLTDYCQKDTSNLDQETLMRRGHSALSRACASYLCQTDIWNLAQILDWRYEHRKSFSFRSKFYFLSYAEENWIAHAREAETLSAAVAKSETVNPILANADHFETWRLIHNRLHPADALSQEYGAVQLAVEHNLSGFLRRQCDGDDKLVNTNTWNWKFGSYLHLAARKNNVAAARVLLDFGADVNTHGTSNETPLVEACRLGHLESASLLLEAGAEVADSSSDGSNDPLVAAAQSGNVDLVKRVLEHASEVYSHPWYRGRSITSLVRWNWEMYHKNLVEPRRNTQVELEQRAQIFRLICQGVSFENPGELQVGPIWMWTFSGCPESSLRSLMDFYLGGPEGNARWLRPVLDMTCWFGSADSARMLLEGLRVGRELPDWILAQSGQTYCTLVHWAALNPRDSVLSYLLELGLSPNLQDTNGETPLHLAARDLKETHIDLLLRHNADRKVSSIRQFRPFHRAVQVITSHTPAQILEKLMVDPTDVNLQVADGVYPIQLASRAGAIMAVRWLLGHGARLEVEDDFRRTVLHSAASAHSPESVEILEFLMDRGQDARARDAAKMTPLHHVLYSYDAGEDLYDPDIALANAKCLLSRGANVNAQDQEGNTPLHLAAWKSHRSLVRLFLRAGAQASKVDNRGLTAIDLAKDEEIREMIEVTWT
ncbi:ankyrin repeat-containing domain protein [Hypoxylon sp. FL1284]|nr:ankyrin repeat-containing domain protein [Hypoxylon sp. FL1284]